MTEPCAVGQGCKEPRDCATGACVSGTCRSVCGDGVKSPDEACDDRNILACGTCSADCKTDQSASPTGCTVAGTGCNVPADCGAGLVCTDNNCVAPPPPPSP